MNWKKLFVICVLSVFVTGILIGGVSAVKTVSINMKSNNYGFDEAHNDVHIGSGDVIHAVNQKKNLQAGKGPMVQLEHNCNVHESSECGKKYKLTGAKFYYKNSKGKVATYTVKSKYGKSKSKYVTDYYFLKGKNAKGWTPYKVVVGYSALTNADKKAINRYGRGGYPSGSCIHSDIVDVKVNKNKITEKVIGDDEFYISSYKNGLYINHWCYGDTFLEYDHVDVKVNGEWLHFSTFNEYCLDISFKSTDKVTCVRFYTLIL